MTLEHLEPRREIIEKRVRTIPLSYFRDVTCEQNFVQAMFGVSTITASPTNGDRIVMKNILDGEIKRETIWRMVLSKS